MIYLFLSYIVVLACLVVLLGRLLCNKKLKNDLFFFVICNFILIFSLTIFYFYYKDYVFSLVNMFLLFLNTLFLIHEIKLVCGKYEFLAMPYLFYMFVLLLYVIRVFLVNQ